MLMVFIPPILECTMARNLTSWGEFDWEKTETHTVRIISKSPGLLHWDYTDIYTD